MFDDALAFLKGFWTTFKYSFKPPVTIQYPDVKRTTADKYRGRHRLYRTDDGLERCIGCSLCAAACPSQAIYVGAAENDPEHPISPGERFAKIYEINMIRCIFCGFCEEACPVDAIKLGPEYELADFNKADFVYTKEMLLEPSRRCGSLDRFARRPHHAQLRLSQPSSDRGAGPAWPVPWARRRARSNLGASGCCRGDQRGHCAGGVQGVKSPHIAPSPRPGPARVRGRPAGCHGGRGQER